MPRRVAIVGAGIVGAMLARALAGNSAHHVTLIDAAMSAGQGVSGRSFGWITQMAGFSAPPPAAFEARAAGRAAYDDLNAAMENKLFVPGEGALVWRDSAAGTEALIAERRALGTRVEALGPEGIARLAPHLAETPPLAAHAPGDIFLRPGLAAARLAQSAAEMGVSLAYGHSVLGVAMQAGRVTGVQLAETIIPADAVVLAAGTGIPRLLPQGATASEIAASPSALITLYAEGPAPTLALSGPGLEIRKDRRADHFLVAAAWRAGDDNTGLDALAAEKRDLAARWFPGLRNWRVASAGIGARPMPRTESGVVAEAAKGVEGLYIACGHPGVAVAPVIAGRIVALLG